MIDIMAQTSSEKWVITKMQHFYWLAFLQKKKKICSTKLLLVGNIFLTEVLIITCRLGYDQLGSAYQRFTALLSRQFSSYYMIHQAIETFIYNIFFGTPPKGDRSQKRVRTRRNGSPHAWERKPAHAGKVDISRV